MKTVKGEVLSMTPVSISKAASILSKFVSADTGAFQAVCAYLRRASISFNELNQLHKELKSHQKHKTLKSETVIEDGELTRNSMWNRHDGEESERKKHEKKKEKKERGWFGNDVKSEGKIFEYKVRIKTVDSDLGIDENKKHKKKRVEFGQLEEGKGTAEVKIEKDGNVGIEDNDRKKHKKNEGENVDKIGNLEEDKDRIKFEEDGNTGMDNGRMIHKKKRETREYHQVGDLKENGGKIVVEEEEEKKKKKRKSQEIKEERETNSDEYRSKKKKKEKVKGKVS